MKIILTGATGMVGEGVLQECLLSNTVEKVLVINRKPCGVTHPKLEEIIHNDCFDLTTIKNKLQGYDACLFCLGVSSVGMKEPEYYRLTYTLTMNVAKTLSELNNKMVFCYISGTHTDRSEKGKIMWARVKGITENDLMKLPFKKVYNFRPGVLQAAKGAKNTLKFYRLLSWLIPVIKLVAPNYICTLKELGQAMINATSRGYTTSIIEIKDIKILAKQ